jgi:DNA topoisomerase I
MKLRHALFTVEPKYKKKDKFNGDESDIDDDWIAAHEEENQQKAIEKAEKKFQKDNEKLAEDGKKPHPDSVLKERIADIKDEFKQLKKERGTQKHELKKARPVEKLEEAIEKLAERITTAKLQMDDRDAGKEVALGTRFVLSFGVIVSVSDNACTQ